MDNVMCTQEPPFACTEVPTPESELGPKRSKEQELPVWDMSSLKSWHLLVGTGRCVQWEGRQEAREPPFAPDPFLLDLLQLRTLYLQDLVPTGPQYPQDLSTYRTSVPTEPQYPQDLSTHSTSVPTGPQYPQDLSTHRTSVPTEPQYPQDLSAYRTSVPTGPQYPQNLSTHSTSVPTGPQYRQYFSTHRTSVPTGSQYPQDLSTHRTSVLTGCGSLAS
ncbi:hypothetical protein STEG23_001455 [Scotinomys teguina]